MSSEDKSTERRSSLGKEDRRRSASPQSDEEELDEFGRVKRRREKFKSERSEDGEYDNRSGSNERDRYHSRRHRRRSSSSSSRSPRRSYRRYHSDSDSDYERQRSSSRPRHRRSTHRSHHGAQRHQTRGSGGDLYTEAAQYIDTEFYPTKVYIGDLEDVTVEQIETIFARFGPLEDVKLVEGKDYGFVTYEKKEAALAAIQSMHGALVGSRHIKVNRAKIPERNKVGFGNVPWQDEDGLMAKEASYNSYSRRRSSTLMKLEDHSYPPITTAIPAGRVLTSYDDL
ncbi:hypothetical protein MFLAVUS_004368 [Mucor flavus]|uniref:RRM domain-containing protein n=1 Tax=Mucor flavus TaxID=439312 RepID=A0ABP9YVP2_9FUNG